MSIERAIDQYLAAKTEADLDAAYNALVENFAADPDLPDDADFESGVDKLLDDRGLPALIQRLHAIRKTELQVRYEAYRVAADGCAGEQVPGGDSDGDVIATRSLDECRRAIADRLELACGGDEIGNLRWLGQDDDVEAYYDSDDEGCGGYHIRPARRA